MSADSPIPAPCQYRTGRTLGRGTFSVVKEALHIPSGEYFACKVINKKFMAGRESMVGNEVKILERVSADHPNIVTLHDYFETANNVYIIFDLSKGGALHNRINDRGKYYETDAIALMRKVCHAVEYIHGCGIAHCDMKPDNLLFDTVKDDAEIMIADFGLSRIMEEQKFSLLKEVCGTPGYMAPEIYTKVGHGTAVDIWALGVITYFLLVGYTPFDRAITHEQVKAVASGHYQFEPDRCWAGVSETARDFIRFCLTVNPHDRPTASQLLKHKWLAGEEHFVPDLLGKPLDLLPSVNQATIEKQTWKRDPYSVEAMWHLTAPLLDGSLGKDLRTLNEAVKALVEEANMEEISTADLVLHYMGNHAQTISAGQTSDSEVAAAERYANENEFDAARGAQRGDLDSKIAQKKMDARSDVDAQPVRHDSSKGRSRSL